MANNNLNCAAPILGAPMNVAIALSRRAPTSMSTMYPGRHDLLLGRGGETNNHSGNITFRGLIEQYKPTYQSAPKGQKPEIAQMLVNQWRALDPPGRFMAKSPDNEDLWVDIGDMAARRRASKSLGERSKRSIVADPAPPMPPLVLKRKREEGSPTSRNAKTVPSSAPATCASDRGSQGETCPKISVLPIAPIGPPDRETLDRMFPGMFPKETASPSTSNSASAYVTTNRPPLPPADQKFTSFVSDLVFGAMSSRKLPNKSSRKGQASKSTGRPAKRFKRIPSQASGRKSNAMASTSNSFVMSINAKGQRANMNSKGSNFLLNELLASSRATAALNNLVAPANTKKTVPSEPAPVQPIAPQEVQGMDGFVVDQVPTAAELTGAVFHSDCSSTGSVPSALLEEIDTV